MNLKIAHLYPELLNLYGDRGNIISLKKRAEWRGIDVEVKEYKLADEIDFENIDILFIGGGSDCEQLLVCQRLKEIKNEIFFYFFFYIGKLFIILLNKTIFSKYNKHLLLSLVFLKCLFSQDFEHSF